MNDTWVYDLSVQVWKKLNLPSILALPLTLFTASPSARSGFSFFATDYCCVLYGGYSKHDKASKRGSAASKGITFSDTWILHMDTDEGPVRYSHVKPQHEKDGSNYETALVKCQRHAQGHQWFTGKTRAFSLEAWRISWILMVNKTRKAYFYLKLRGA